MWRWAAAASQVVAPPTDPVVGRPRTWRPEAQRSYLGVYLPRPPLEPSRRRESGVPRNPPHPRASSGFPNNTSSTPSARARDDEVGIAFVRGGRVSPSTV